MAVRTRDFVRASVVAVPAGFDETLEKCLETLDRRVAASGSPHAVTTLVRETKGGEKLLVIRDADFQSFITLAGGTSTFVKADLTPEGQ